MPIDLITFLDKIKDLNAYEQATELWKYQWLPLGLGVLLYIIAVLIFASIFDVLDKKTFWGLILLPLIIFIIYFVLYPIWLYYLFGVGL